MQRITDIYKNYNEMIETLEKQQETTENRIITSNSIPKSTEKGYYYESVSSNNYIGYFITSTQFTYIEQGKENYNRGMYQYKFVKTFSEDEKSFMINTIDDYDNLLSGIDFPQNNIDGCSGFIALKYKNNINNNK